VQRKFTNDNRKATIDKRHLRTGQLKNDKRQRHMTSVHYTKAQLVTAGMLKNIMWFCWTRRYMHWEQESWATAKMTARCALHMGALKNFESLSTPMATFDKIFNGLLFRLILWMCSQNLKFVALPVPEIIGGTPKLGSSWIRQPSLFPQIFHGLLLGWTLWMLLDAISIDKIILISDQ